MDNREKAFKLPNTRSGHDKFSRFLLDQGLPVIAALEPTADFYRPIAYRLADAGITLHLTWSLAYARVREAVYTSWDKHDRKDAKVVPHMLTHGMTQPLHDPLRESYLDLQEISNACHQIASARLRGQHILVDHYLKLYSPDMERYVHTSRTEPCVKKLTHKNRKANFSSTLFYNRIIYKFFE